MKKQETLQIGIIAVLAITVLVMTVGFAYYQADLEFNGAVTVSPANWSVHFDDQVSVTAGSQEIEYDVSEGTTVIWSTTLSNPGEYAEFTVNVLNEGTFNAILTDIMMSGHTAHSDYLKYEVYYNNSDTPYESTKSGLNISLAKKTTTATSAPVKVRVTYIAPSDSSKLPSSAVTANLALNLTYKQEGYSN